MRSETLYAHGPGYYEELLQDKARLNELHPMTFHHLNALLEREIRKIKDDNPSIVSSEESNSLHEEFGNIVCLTEKVYIANDKFPDYNFAGRILGPRGMTVKQMEQRSGCRIEVRGKGSFKCSNTNKDEPLHVIISAQDTESRAKAKLEQGKSELAKLLHPKLDGMDEIKKKQLMELAIINGNYRPPVQVVSSTTGQPVMSCCTTASTTAISTMMPTVATSNGNVSNMAVTAVPQPQHHNVAVPQSQPVYLLFRPQYIRQPAAVHPMQQQIAPQMFVDPTQQLTFVSSMPLPPGAGGDNRLHAS